MNISLKAVSKIALLSSGFALAGAGCVADNEPLRPGQDPFGNGDQVAEPGGGAPPPPIVVDPNVATADAPQPAVFAQDQVNPSNLIVSGDSIYWVESARNSVKLKWLHVDGGETFHATGLNSLPFSTAADDAGLYFAASSEQNIVFAPHLGLDAEPLHASVTDPLAIALTEDYAYWTAANGCLFQGAKEGGPAVILGCAPDAATSLALVNGVAYMATTEGALYRAELEEGGAFDKIASDEDFGNGLVADASGVYWVDSANRQVRRYRHTSGVVSVLAGSQFSPIAVAQDRFYLYFSTQGDGAVKRILKAGGAVEVMAEQQDEPGELVVTDEFIYWINEGDGSVMRLLKNYNY
ncbi:MAG: hypothetical protein GY811_20780 [Myxococcales bacterium]|nr:hypothetical protein [Myxococcales bacterium]